MREFTAIVVALLVMALFLVVVMFVVCICAMSMRSEVVGFLGATLGVIATLFVGYTVASAIIHDGPRFTDEDHANATKALRSMVDTYEDQKKTESNQPGRSK